MSVHNPKLIQWYIGLHLGILNYVHYDLVVMSGQSNFQFVYERIFVLFMKTVFSFGTGFPLHIYYIICGYSSGAPPI